MGIVAARLADRLHRPVVIFSRSGDYLSGSGRSYGGYDLYQAVQACSDCLLNFGGHMFATGMSVAPDRLGEFRSRLEQYTEEHQDTNHPFLPKLHIDTRLDAQEISRNLLPLRHG